MNKKEFLNKLLATIPNLKNFSRKLTRDPLNASDLVQETILKAFLNQDKFKPGTNMQSWVYRIMQNSFINNYKSNKRYLLIDHFDPGDISKKYSKDPDEYLVLSDIHKAIDSLENPLRIAFELYLDGFKYQEIANDLDIPIGTAKSRVFNAKSKLKKLLRKHDPT